MVKAEATKAGSPEHQVLPTSDEREGGGIDKDTLLPDGLGTWR